MIANGLAQNVKIITSFKCRDDSTRGEPINERLGEMPKVLVLQREATEGITAVRVKARAQNGEVGSKIRHDFIEVATIEAPIAVHGVAHWQRTI